MGILNRAYQFGVFFPFFTIIYVAILVIRSINHNQNINQMKIQTWLLSFMLYLITMQAAGQATDNAGKDLFVIKNTSSFSFPLSSNSVAINYTSSFNATDTIEISQARY